MTDIFSNFEQGSVTVKDVDAQKFIAAYAAHLKKSGKLEVPKWADLVKTATQKQHGPYDADWFFVRCASIARRIYLQPGLGIKSLNAKYGGAEKIGFHPNRFHAASGSVNRAAIHALEKLKVIEKHGVAGRKVSRDGQKDVDRIAVQIAKAQ
ncbi:40S small subunit ribosomal protein eS19 (rpS19) [Andalucia godoyi]|uniref:40S small subunit ribosomal protein eS19 (RpS19) n=1 Tax=Andalucia godoyi TaxID=505711 RepID=A0A8K0AII8_ANDGO|nr:40S small subunit ribosomal protein eS19 (rpS19) [Andalucia godoyi]WCZ58596.1 40S ribosomal protein S19 [Andalucia godoyi]|eukprot:ANDGO_04775.mRNA.1 40S small subunit ribosomal protein eS19 (rpS19)